MAHDTIYDDPCPLAWQVKKILWLEPTIRNRRQDPCRLVRQVNQILTRMIYRAWQVSRPREGCRIMAELPVVIEGCRILAAPATQGGKGLQPRRPSSPAGRAGRGRDAKARRAAEAPGLRSAPSRPVLATESSSPAGRAGRGRDAKRVVRLMSRMATYPS